MTAYRWLLVGAMTLTGTHSPAATELVRDGRPAATIVIPDDALPVARFASEELQYHVKKATGAKLPVVSESEQPDESSRVFLGACREAAAGLELRDLPPNGYVIKSVGADLFLAGDDSDGEPGWIQHNNRTRVGTLFAVYELLETDLGCRWLWPGPLGEVIPRRSSVAIGDWDHRGRPAFIHARWRDGGASVAGERGWASPATRSAFLSAQGKWLRRNRFAMGVNMDMKHAFTGWWEHRGEEHPEYFNLLPDGTRRPDPTYYGGAPTLVSMCVSNPQFQAAIVRDWEATRSAGNPYIDASENDTPGKCTCDSCMAWDVEDPDLEAPWDERISHATEAFETADDQWARFLGSMSDRYARYYLAVQEQARGVDPEAVVMGFAYANYVEPPRETMLNDHIIIGIVPPLMFPWTAEKRGAVREQWQGWSATGARLFLRPNYMLDGHNMPIYFADQLGEDFRFCASHGMIGTDFDSLTGQYATQGPNLYVLARLHARPDMAVSEVLDEYYSAFGNAETQVREYFGHWKRICDALAEAPEGTDWVTFYRGANRIFTPEAMDVAKRILDRAAEAASGDPTAKRRVAFLQEGLQNAALTLQTQVAYRRYRDEGDLDAFRAAINALDEYRASVEADFVANMCFLTWAEARTWDRELLRLMSAPGDELPGPWRFAWDPDGVGGTEGWFGEDFEDGGWLTTAIDGPWEEQAVGKQWKADHGDDYNGLAWYRTQFEVAQDDARPIVRLVFGAVDEACVIWLNGERIHERPFPYQGDVDSWQQAFEVDISDTVRYDAPNTLTVRVEDNAGAGGIWRPVWIVRSARAASDEANLVPDGGFENGPGAWKQNVMCGQHTFAVDGRIAHSGRASGRIHCTALGPPEVEETHRTRAWARWYQTGIAVDPGATYRLRLWARTERNFGGTLRIWVTGTGESGTTEAKLPSTQGLWHEVVVEGIRPKGETVAIYLNLMDGVGTAWFDDVELVAEGAK